MWFTVSEVYNMSHIIIIIIIIIKDICIAQNC